MQVTILAIITDGTHCLSLHHSHLAAWSQLMSFIDARWGPVRGWSKTYALMTAIRDAGRVYLVAGRKTSVRIDLGGCAADA